MKLCLSSFSFCVMCFVYGEFILLQNFSWYFMIQWSVVFFIIIPLDSCLSTSCCSGWTLWKMTIWTYKTICLILFLRMKIKSWDALVQLEVMLTSMDSMKNTVQLLDSIIPYFQIHQSPFIQIWVVPSLIQFHILILIGIW